MSDLNHLNITLNTIFVHSVIGLFLSQEASASDKKWSLRLLTSWSHQIIEAIRVVFNASVIFINKLK